MRRAIGRAGMTVMSLALLLLARPAAADLEDVLASRWSGSWVVIGVDFTSDCNGSYTNNEVIGRRTNGKGSTRLAAGELARVHKLELKRDRVEMLLDVDENLLRPFEDGPFRLVEEVSCKVELKVPVPREAVKSKDPAGVEATLAPVLERFDREEDARRAARWNRRERGPYPQDYEAKLAAYKRWKAEQVNAAIDRRIAEALDTAARAVQHSSDDADYGAGLAAGMDAMRWISYSDCESWLGSNFWSAKRSCASGKGYAYNQGCEDGQAIAYHLLLAQRLQGCRVEAPR